MLIPTFRAINSDNLEENITFRLHSSGFTLMGLRVYETLLLIKYINAKKYLDGSAIGIMGHSAGSDTAMLVSRISPQIRAGVFDLLDDYLTGMSRLKGFHCQIVPGLSYYASAINDLATLSFPAKKIFYDSYRNPDIEQEILQFFKNNLSNTNR